MIHSHKRKSNKKPCIFIINGLYYTKELFTPCFMNKKTSKAKSVSADIEVRVKSASGTTYRALVEKRNKKVTYLCQHIRGAFTKDRKIAKPLTELVISGEYTLPHVKHREMVEKLFKVTLSDPERKPRRRSTNDAIQRVEVIPPWLMDEEEQQTQTEAPSDAEIEAALWQEVEEAREAERAEELNEPVTDVEPPVELVCSGQPELSIL